MIGKNILDEYIKFGCLYKYKNQAMVADALNKYIAGDGNAITRDQGYRNLFASSLGAEKVYNITQGDPYRYVTELMKKYALAKDLFDSVTEATYNDFGEAHLAAALNLSINGNYSMFDPSTMTMLATLTTSHDMVRFMNDTIAGQVTELNKTLGEQTASVIAKKLSLENGRSR